MTEPSFARRPPVHALLVLSAAALAGCGSGPVVPPPERPAECREPSEVTAPLPPADTLFVLEASPSLTPEQERRLDAIRDVPSTARVHLARLAADAGAILGSGEPVAVPVSPTRAFLARRQSTGSSGDFWYGRIDGDGGEVSFFLGGQGVLGGLTSIPTQGTPVVYAFEPLGGGLQAVVCVDPSKIPPD